MTLNISVFPKTFRVITANNLQILQNTDRVGSISRFYSIFDEIMLANNVDPDKTPHNVASDLGLHCFPITFTSFQVRMG